MCDNHDVLVVYVRCAGAGKKVASADVCGGLLDDVLVSHLRVGQCILLLKHTLTPAQLLNPWGYRYQDNECAGNGHV